VRNRRARFRPGRGKFVCVFFSPLKRPSSGHFFLGIWGCPSFSGPFGRTCEWISGRDRQASLMAHRPWEPEPQLGSGC
jgi:hypothetical protein